MNEHWRARKIKMSKDINEYNLIWYRNFIKGAIFSLIPALYISLRQRSFYGVPKYFNAKYFNGAQNWRNDINAYVKYHKGMVSISLILTGGFVWAEMWTSRRKIFDEYYQNKSAILPQEE